MTANQTKAHGNLPPLEPLPARLRTFAVQLAWVSAVFAAVYPVSGWLAALGSRRYVLYSSAELDIPLMPGWFFPYMSIYGVIALIPFFLDCEAIKRLAKALMVGVVLAGLCFILFPASVGFTLVVPEAEPYRTLFHLMLRIDSPFNTAPSLHVSCATGIVLAICARAGTVQRGLFGIWLVALMCSTVLVHQHHIFDVITGFALAVCLHWRYCRASIGGAGLTPPQSDR